MTTPHHGGPRHMRWSKTFLTEVSEKIQQLGLRSCPVCGSEASLGVGRLPVYLIGGALPPVAAGRPHSADQDQRTDYAVRVDAPCAAT